MLAPFLGNTAEAANNPVQNTAPRQLLLPWSTIVWINPDTQAATS